MGDALLKAGLIESDRRTTVSPFTIPSASALAQTIEGAIAGTFKNATIEDASGGIDVDLVVRSILDQGGDAEVDVREEGGRQVLDLRFQNSKHALVHLTGFPVDIQPDEVGPDGQLLTTRTFGIASQQHVDFMKKEPGIGRGLLKRFGIGQKRIR